MHKDQRTMPWKNGRHSEKGGCIDPVMILHASWSDVIRVISGKQNGHVPFTSQPYPKFQYLLKFLRSILDCQNGIFIFFLGGVGV